MFKRLIVKLAGVFTKGILAATLMMLVPVGVYAASTAGETVCAEGWCGNEGKGKIVHVNSRPEVREI